MLRRINQGLVKVLLFCLFASGPLFAVERANVVGDARDSQTGELLYREYYYYSADGDHWRVEYRSAENNELVVYKEVDFKAGPQGTKSQPNFTQQDIRFGETLSSRRQGDELLLSYSESSKDQPDQRNVAVKQPLVVDAGFDGFVRENWQSLQAGQAVSFYYAFPSRQQLVRLAIRADSGDACQDDTQRSCFQIKPASWVLTLFVAPINLVYDQQKRLLQFSGLSNIKGNDGQPQNVVIRYRYL